MPRLSERGAAHIIALIILILGIVAGVYLIKSPENFYKLFNPKATGETVRFVDDSGNDITTITSATVKVQLVDPIWTSAVTTPSLFKYTTKNTASCQRPGQPTNLKPQGSIKPGNTTLTWDTVADATKGYWLAIDDKTNPVAGCGPKVTPNPGDVCILITTNSYSFNFQTSKLYEWGVAAANNCGMSTPSIVRIAVGPRPTPTATPVPTETPSSTPTPTPVPVTTQSVVFAEDPNFTVNVITNAFTTSPIPYTFSSSIAGTKLLYAKFISSDGREQNASPYPATITLITPSPTPPAIQPTVAVIEIEDRNAPEPYKIAANKFYEQYEDNYDFLAVSYDFDKREYLHATVKNDVQGIGSQNWYLDGAIPKLDPNPIFDHTEEYGSNGRLLGIGVLGPIADYLGPSGGDPAWLEEVIGHQFGVYIGGLRNSQDLLPVQNPTTPGHWTNCMSFPKDDPTQPYWSARYWRDNGDGTWTRDDGDYFSKQLKFDPLILYLMGFLPPEEVPPVTLLEPEGGYSSEHECSPGSTIRATPRQITVNDVIQRHGPRIPSFNDSQKEFSTAFILLVQKGSQPSPGAVEKLTEWAERFPEVIREATSYP